jgi:GT2 family glycosyltransferase
MAPVEITLSVVSHRQNALVNLLLGDLQRLNLEGVALLLTENVPDPVPLETANLSGALQVLRNERPAGFGANHNAAFRRCASRYFCVCNPDVRLTSDPFPPLRSALADPRVAVAAPLVRRPDGGIEDSVRRFPTLASLLVRLLHEPRAPDYPVDRGPQRVDWAAGMFLLFRSEAYRAVGGFDEAYFLYYEDVDICRRLAQAGHAVVFQPGAEVLHDARRGSRSDLTLVRHHLASLFRFLRGSRERSRSAT